MSDPKYDAEKLQADSQAYLDSFKTKMKAIADEIMGELYVNCLPHIETDSWTNYREALRMDLSHEYKYKTFKEPWATDLRRAIFVEHREELSKLISQDMLDKIKNYEENLQTYPQFAYSTYETIKDIKAERDKLLAENAELKKQSDHEQNFQIYPGGYVDSESYLKLEAENAELKGENNRLTYELDKSRDSHGRVIQDLEAKIAIAERKINSVLAYCNPHYEMMWAASIMGALLDCDFRDANEAFKNKTNEGKNKCQT